MESTRALLVERGYERTTVSAIAERSGVHASAIYRRWPSRLPIIEEAVFPGLQAHDVTPTGDLRTDLLRFVTAYDTAFRAPPLRAALPGLFGAYQVDGRSGAPEGWLAVSARPQFVGILEAAGTDILAAADSTPPSIEPDDVFDVLMGALLARSFVPTVIARNRPIEQLVTLTIRMLSPSTPDAGDASGAHSHPNRARSAR